MNDVSVVIPSYNSALTIARTLEGILAQKDVFAKEIIVVDSSDDGRTGEVLSVFEGRGVKVIRLGQKTMPAIGRNVGAKQASGAILAFIDSDAYPAEDWVRRIGEAYAAGCRAGGGAILLPPEQRSRTIALAQYFLQFNEFMDGSAPRVVPFTPSCNLFCEKRLFDEIGGFPEIRASEDVLFGRAVSLREKIHFNPDIRVYHVFRERTDSYFQNQKMLGRYILIQRRDFMKEGWCQGWTPLFLAPAVVFVKFLRISARVLFSGGWSVFCRYLTALPLFLAGLGFWGKGFAAACFEKSAKEGIA